MSVPPQKLMLLFYGRNNGKSAIGQNATVTLPRASIRNKIQTTEVGKISNVRRKPSRKGYK